MQVGKLNPWNEMGKLDKDMQGVYILAGNGALYIGEGNLKSRIATHKKTKSKLTKLGQFEVYYCILEQSYLNKSIGLQLEGALTEYFSKFTSNVVINTKNVQEVVDDNIQQMAYYIINQCNGLGLSGRTHLIKAKYSLPYNTLVAEHEDYFTVEQTECPFLVPGSIYQDIKTLQIILGQ